jgi:16S rRNA (guanine527-N7)-methyltransferase
VNESRHVRLQAVAGPVSRETFERLVAFEAAFLRWNRVTNLVAPSTLPDIWERHVLDSAQLLPLGGEARHWLDLGSGGGFPGIVLAILFKDRPGGFVHLVESNRKKASFLQSVIGQLDLPARVHPVRIETAASIVGDVEIVTARALASLGELFGFAEPWISRGARALFHKGRDYRREVEETIHNWESELIEHPSAVDRSSVILEIRALRRRS